MTPPFLSDGAPTPRPALSTTGIDPSGGESVRLTDRVTHAFNSRVHRISTFEGIRGRSARLALALKWVSYYLLVLLCSGLTEALTANVQYATHGGVFMLIASAVVAVTGAFATLLYVNLRTEIIEKVRHYIFGLMLIPGLLMALVIRLIQEWEWINTGSIGSTLTAALPMLFLATVVIPMFVFLKEMLAMRTIYRSKMDDQEAVALWSRQDGLQR